MSSRAYEYEISTWSNVNEQDIAMHQDTIWPKGNKTLSIKWNDCRHQK